MEGSGRTRDHACQNLLSEVGRRGLPTAPLVGLVAIGRPVDAQAAGQEIESAMASPGGVWRFVRAAEAGAALDGQPALAGSLTPPEDLLAAVLPWAEADRIGPSDHARNAGLAEILSAHASLLEAGARSAVGLAPGGLAGQAPWTIVRLVVHLLSSLARDGAAWARVEAAAQLPRDPVVEAALRQATGGAHCADGGCVFGREHARLTAVFFRAWREVFEGPSTARVITLAGRPSFHAPGAHVWSWYLDGARRVVIPFDGASAALMASCSGGPTFNPLFDALAYNNVSAFLAGLLEGWYEAAPLAFIERWLSAQGLSVAARLVLRIGLHGALPLVARRCLAEALPRFRGVDLATSLESAVFLRDPVERLTGVDLDHDMATALGLLEASDILEPDEMDRRQRGLLALHHRRAAVAYLRAGDEAASARHQARVRELDADAEPISGWPAEAARPTQASNALCDCGSGRRFKRCHGA